MIVSANYRVEQIRIAPSLQNPSEANWFGTGGVGELSRAYRRQKEENSNFLNAPDFKRPRFNIGSSGQSREQGSVTAMIEFLSPESLSKVHITILEIEGILFNILLFCKFAVHEIKALTKRRRKRGPT